MLSRLIIKMSAKKRSQFLERIVCMRSTYRSGWTKGPEAMSSFLRDAIENYKKWLLAGAFNIEYAHANKYKENTFQLLVTYLAFRMNRLVRKDFWSNIKTPQHGEVNKQIPSNNNELPDEFQSWIDKVKRKFSNEDLLRVGLKWCS